MTDKEHGDLVEHETRCLMDGLAEGTRQWVSAHRKDKVPEDVLLDATLNAHWNLGIEAYYSIMSTYGKKTHAEIMDIMSRHLLSTLDCKIKGQSRMASFAEFEKGDDAPEGGNIQ